MKKIGIIIGQTKFKDRPKNLSKEFQLYGVFLAETLDDTKHYSLYIKFAKEIPRTTLEQALNYTKDYPNPKSKARLFMWKLTQLRKNQPK